jgi:DNA polymerase III delta subunit
VRNYILNQEINQESVISCYFFHGEETYLAQQFTRKLQEVLISPDIQEFNLERFNLEEHSWMEIIDLARTIPFFLSSWRIIVVEASPGKNESLSQTEKTILKDYFVSPSSQTVMVIIFSGKIRKNSSLFRFFSSLPSSLVLIKELRPLKEKSLFSWMDRKLSSLGKAATPEAKKRVEELLGSDLRRLSHELEKLATFIGEKKTIELDDVNQVSGWAATSFEWELGESLEKADFEQSLVVMNDLFKEGIRPEFILGMMVRFFHEILLAKLWLKEKEKDRKAIFKELKPHIHEGYGRFYMIKFREFFSFVEKVSASELNHCLDELAKIDLKMKTSDASVQTLLESFLYEYCRLYRQERIIWKKKG